MRTLGKEGAGRCAKDGFLNLLLKNGNNLASVQAEVKERERGEWECRETISGERSKWDWP